MDRTFYPLRVAEIRRETADTVSIALDVPPDLADRFSFRPGQFLTFRVLGLDGGTADRSYSICSTPDDDELRVVVKRLAGGVFGERAHTTMAVGDVLDTLPPQGRFTTQVDPSRTHSYLAIAAGSGISPVMSVIRAVLMTEPESRVTLLYGNRGQSSVIFRDALADLKDKYLSRLDIVHVFSREQQDAELFNGRLTTAKLTELAKQLVDIPAYDEAFVCGPEPMTLELRQALIDLGLPADRIHLELFGSHVAAPIRPSETADSETVHLDVALGGIRRSIDGHRDETILDAARDAGLDVPFSCTGGVCATCRARVIDGDIEMQVNYALQPWELEAGFVLTCQSRPTTPAVTVDYDAV